MDEVVYETGLPNERQGHLPLPDKEDVFGLIVI